MILPPPAFVTRFLTVSGGGENWRVIFYETASGGADSNSSRRQIVDNRPCSLQGDYREKSIEESVPVR